MGQPRTIIFRTSITYETPIQGFGLKGTYTWKALMQTAYILLTTKDLIQIDFSQADAKETLKLIGQEFIGSYASIFDTIPDTWGQKAAQRIIK